MMSSPSSRKRKFSESEGAKKVIVGNLAYSVETKDLRDYFENEVGNVSQAKVFDDNFGRSMGVGFVEFRNADSARSACRKLNRQEWKMRRITVQLTDEEEIERLRRAGKENNRSKKSGVCSNKVYLMNLAYEATWMGVKDLFRNEVGGVNFVELYNDSNGRPRGCGIIEFENEEITSKAIRKMDNFEYLGRKMIVQEALDIQRDKHGYALKKTGTEGGSVKESAPSHHVPNNMGHVNFGETYGLAPSFLDALKIDGPLRSKLFVGNLAYDVDEKKIRDVFRLAGKVVAVDLPRDKEGKSKGFAIVEMSHPVEAVQAISMLGGKKLFDRTLSVRMDRESPNDDYPNRLPEGLEGVGPGLGINGNPLRNVVDEIIRKQSNQHVAHAPPQFNELVASAKTISELTPTLSLLAQHLKPSQPEHTIQDPANQLAKAVAEIISRQQEQNNMSVMSHLPQQDQVRGVSQPPVFDHLQDLRGQVGHQFGHQSSNQSQHGDNFNGSQLRAGQPFNQHESRGYSSNDYSTSNSSARMEPTVAKYVTSSKQQQQHSSRGSSTERGFYDSFAYGSRDAQPSSGSALQNYGSNPSSRWEFSNEVKETPRSATIPHQDSIAVSNLPNAFGENDVYDMFRKYGRIRNIKFSRPGTCLVVFEDAPAATRALEVKSQYWDRNLEIRLC